MFQRLVTDGHFLRYEDGKPFFYLADTAWELLHRLTLEETKRYLADRNEKGFTVIQTVAVGELDGTKVPNAEGELPFRGEEVNEAYFRHVDQVLEEAEKLQLFVGLLPSWGPTGKRNHRTGGSRKKSPLPTGGFWENVTVREI